MLSGGLWADTCLLRVELGPWLVALVTPPVKTHVLFSGNVKKLAETYPNVSNSRNAELRLRWGQIVLKNDHQEDFWKVKEFLQSQVSDPTSCPIQARGGPLASPATVLCVEPHRLPLCGQSGGGTGCGGRTLLRVAGEGVAMAGKPTGLGSFSGISWCGLRGPSWSS